MSDRVAPGGKSTVSLGMEDSGRILRERQAQRTAGVNTPDARARFPQAPGGSSTICLGAGGPPEASECSTTRGPVGGADGVVLGADDWAAIVRQREGVRDVETPAPLPRISQAPGGAASIILGGAVPEPIARQARVAPGGVSTLVLGGSALPDDASDQASVATRGPVGGKSTIVFGGEGPCEGSPQTARGPVGGDDTVCLGSDDAREAFDAHRRLREAIICTPDALARFPQAPGGDSTLCFGGQEFVTVATRGPVGGEAHVVLGADDWAELMRQRGQVSTIATPDALPRFPQAPGGTASIVLGGAAPEEPLVRQARIAPGGASTLVFGGCGLPDDASDQASIATRGPVGGKSTIVFGGEGPCEGSPQAVRGPVGGDDTVCLGTDDAREAFDTRRRLREAIVCTPDALSRFPQAPGGDSKLCLGGQDGFVAVATRGPVGGEAHVVLGRDDWAELMRQRGQDGSIDTPEPLPRFTQAPGGDASISLGGDPTVVTPSRGPVGGEASVVLGIDDWAGIVRERQQALMKAMAAETPAPPSRFSQAPGGAASIVLGSAEAEAPPAASLGHQARVAPGGASTLLLGGGYPHDLVAQVSANRFADGTRQNTGNFITGRPTTRLHHAPGGESTICLGDGSTPVAPDRNVSVSANRYASGAHQNSGNVITDRPTTRLHQAPGGTSTLVLGGGYPDDIVSANKFASGTRQNIGNTITNRPTTRRMQAPGGNSTICLGEDENVDTSNLAHRTPVKKGQEPVKGEAATQAEGSPAVVLGGC